MTISDDPERRWNSGLSQSNSLSAPLVVWLGAQLLAIVLATARIPLWAGMPTATELLALQYLLIVQVSVSSLIFPWLLRSRASSAIVVATAWPMIFLAGLLSPAPLETVALAGVFISGWLLGLAILRSPLPPTGLPLAAPVVVLWACGGPILQFLNLEYGGATLPGQLLGRLAFGPIIAAIRLIRGEFAAAFEVLIGGMIACAVLGGTAFLINRRRRFDNLGRG